MRVTLKDIAEKAGVTKTTVSMALRDDSGISQKTREKIRCVAEELGYAADPILHRLAEYRRPGGAAEFQSVIAWVNHWKQPERLRGYHEFEQYWCGAKLASKRMGYRLEELVWPENDSARNAEDWLLSRQVQGLLIPPHPPEADWDSFGWNKFSLIRFGLSVREVDSNLVTADHQRAVVMALKIIYDYGYRRIGLVYDAAHDRSMGGNLYGGYSWAHKLLALKQTIPPLDFDVQDSASRGGERLKVWMKRHHPEAVLTTAPQTPVFLRDLGWRIPHDVAVAGTSLHDISVDAGIDQCSHAIGQIAAEMLIKQISLNERGAPPDPCRILVESRWQDGKSLPRRR